MAPYSCPVVDTQLGQVAHGRKHPLEFRTARCLSDHFPARRDAYACGQSRWQLHRLSHFRHHDLRLQEQCQGAHIRKLAAPIQGTQAGDRRGKKMAVFDDLEPERKLVIYSHRIDWRGRIPVAQNPKVNAFPSPMANRSAISVNTSCTTPSRRARPREPMVAARFVCFRCSRQASSRSYPRGS